MKRLHFLLLAMCFCTVVMAEGFKRPTSFNYLRGCEAIEEENYEEAEHYLDLELKETPKNGYAWAWMMTIHINNDDYGEALSCGQKAIQYLPKKDNEYQSFVHMNLSKTYYYLDLKDKAFEEITLAINADPDDLDLLAMRADLHYKYKEYNQSNTDFLGILEKNPGDISAHMGVGRNYLELKQYKDAIDKFSYVINMDEKFSQAYAFRADCYLGCGDNNAAAHDFVKALEIDDNNRAFYNLHLLNDTCYKNMAILMKVKTTKDKDIKWNFYLGVLHQSHRYYKEAIEQYRIFAQQEEIALVYGNISECYGELGDYDNALRNAEMGLSLDSADIDMGIARANSLYYLGRTKEAIAQMDACVEMDPENYYSYYRRGFFKDNTRDVDGAIEDYTYALVLEPDYSYAFMARGDMYRLKGDSLSANIDYRLAVDKDTVIRENGNCRQYAYLMLGMRDSAENHMNIILEKYPNDGNYYDAACLMSRMGEKVKAIQYLEMAFKKGYSDFKHLEFDDDMDNVRNEQKYKELVSKYQKIVEKDCKESEECESSTCEKEITEIPFKKDGNMMMIQCTINNLPLHFIFDTGASDVSISDVEANFMMKNGYLSKEDIVGKQYYGVADGSIHEGTVINLKQVKFGDLELKNIRASVVKSQKAPLLLGQSVFSRLGKIEIDNSEKIVKVTHSKK